MKVCSKCEQEKELSEFGNNKTKKDGLQDSCKLCIRNEQIKCYNKDKVKYFVRNNNRKKQIQKEFNELKSTLSCKKCDENRYWILDFHHLDPKEKEDFIHKILFNFGGIESKKFKEEVDKCIVLCSNCHRDFHHKERQNGITIEQYLDL